MSPETARYLYSVIKQVHESGFHCDECPPDHASNAGGTCPLLLDAITSERGDDMLKVADRAVRDAVLTEAILIARSYKPKPLAVAMSRRLDTQTRDEIHAEQRGERIAAEEIARKLEEYRGRS